ncbi:23S rRNA (pseudouridine(1915)-N(3))-methyltransferase RlmH [Candidatus Uhrbacteria bacterium CG22_combo_CG10-13_8_21_14_all_47_17]|uniref:Ribosomal RNA large subunit methyltransferase H n=1 Tax=Candidatus Uhrbacteria bacterium CG22_combo_CG10-13_8_21_14_all_47_17 TaxID=1975041 RepID=A0A2H0BSP3_9BACT|nr:MAG: 23S rRNA (pseudouridine(1915)-N(3))-methyltransferase RlmH [Candidatus Uhrbacteria bacterium CG22_combo_CG10-13_8_21_14_all_47_17]
MKSYEIRAIGKTTEAWQSEAIKSWLTRLSPYIKTSIKELPEGHEGSVKPDLAKTRAREAEVLLKKLPEQAFIVALDETGKNISSEALAHELEQQTDNGTAIVFLIGGSWGLDESVRHRANLVLSFGKQTLPHNLVKIILLEQLFRTEAILRGKTYHK